MLTASSSPALYLDYGADACDDALLISPDGGFFQGNTSNVSANFSAGCDASGGAPKGAPDQLLKLVLDAPKRVI